MNKKNLRYSISFFGMLVCSMVICLMISCSSHRSDDFKRLLDTFDQADAAYKKGETAKAIETFKQCVEECSDGQYERDDSVKLLLPKAMGQLLNAYQVQGDLDGCVTYFDLLKQTVDGEPNRQNEVLCRHFKHDVYVLLAYALSRTDAEEKAVHVMNQALRMPLEYPTPERRFRDDAYAAAVYFCVPSCHEQVMVYGRKALDVVRECRNKSGVQWLVTALGSMYHRQGKIDKAIEMYQEGYDLAALSNDTLGMANAKKMMADYLLQWKLDSISDDYATEAVGLLSHVSNANPMVSTGIYVTKARILKGQHRKQEALEYLRKAKESSTGLPYNSGPSDVDLLMGSLLLDKSKPHFTGDEKEGMAFLTSAAHQATFQIKATAFFELAKANIERGHRVEGEAALDSMWHILHSASSPLMVDGAYDYALNYYLKIGNRAKIAMYSEALQQMKSKAEQAASIKKVIDVITHLEVEKKEKDWTHESEAMSNNQMARNILWIALMLLFVMGIGVVYYRKRRQYVRSHAQTNQELSLVREELEQTKNQKEQVLTELAEVKAENVQQMKQTDNLLAVLKKDGLAKFLENFEKAYPLFLQKLRINMAGMTDKDAVYCCLIALGLDNSRITQTLYVERSTVVMAKYRLRKKLDLDEKSTLEKYLKNLWVDKMG